MIQAIDMFVDPTYRQCQSEEGFYDYIAYWKIVASCRNHLGGIAYYGCRNVFQTQEDAQTALNNMGTIITLNMWDEIGQDNRTIDDLEREWNEMGLREHMGLPL